MVSKKNEVNVCMVAWKAIGDTLNEQSRSQKTYSSRELEESPFTHTSVHAHTSVSEQKSLGKDRANLPMGLPQTCFWEGKGA